MHSTDILLSLIGNDVISKVVFQNSHQNTCINVRASGHEILKHLPWLNHFIWPLLIFLAD